MVVLLKNILWLLVVAGIDPLFTARAQASGMSCQAVFEKELPTFKTSELTQKDFESVQTYEQLETFTEGLVARKLDPVSLVIALAETNFAQHSRWLTQDILFYLLHLEAKKGLKIPLKMFPSQEGKIQNKNSIQSHYDLERHTAFIEVFKAKSLELELSASMTMQKPLRDAEFLRLLLGDSEKNPDLRVIWRVHRPENPVEIAPGSWRLRPHKKNTVDYVLDPNADSPYQIVNRFLGKPVPDQRFFENVYKNYQDRIRDEIIDQVKKAEATLPELRMSYGLVFETTQNQVVGTVRIFDGTPRRLSDVVIPGHAEVSPVLPFEAIFKARNVPVNFIKKLEKMRRDDPYTPVFEIGKLSLEGSRRVRDRSLKTLELFVLQYYMSRYPNAIFVVHVASEAHLKLYQQRYGFKIEESVTIPGTEMVEHILTLPAPKFREALKARLEL